MGFHMQIRPRLCPCACGARVHAAGACSTHTWGQTPMIRCIAGISPRISMPSTSASPAQQGQRGEEEPLKGSLSLSLSLSPSFL